MKSFLLPPRDPDLYQLQREQELADAKKPPIINLYPGGDKEGRSLLDKFGSTRSTSSSTAGAPTTKQTEVDWGDNLSAADFMAFTVTDGDVASSDRIVAWLAYEAPTDKDLDELEFDGFTISTVAGTGEFTLALLSLNGPVYGAFKFNYIIGGS